MKRTFTSNLLMAVTALLVAACSGEETQAQTATTNMEININVGNKTFVAEIENTETGRAFVNSLPLTLNMSELNGNEKYYYLDKSLPTAAQHYGTIQAGDLMLYGNTCIVLFYGQAGGYSYTRLGKLKTTEGLAQAVGSGSVSVTFYLSATTDLRPASATGSNGEKYSFNGTRLRQEPGKGVFIMNGKKFIK